METKAISKRFYRNSFMFCGIRIKFFGRKKSGRDSRSVRRSPHSTFRDVLALNNSLATFKLKVILSKEKTTLFAVNRRPSSSRRV